MVEDRIDALRLEEAGPFLVHRAESAAIPETWDWEGSPRERLPDRISRERLEAYIRLIDR
jgi:hypothetical protein